MLPIYAMYRDKRNFGSQAASNGAKTICAVFLFLIFNLFRDTFVLIFISKACYNKYRLVFDNDHYVLIALALFLSVFFISGKELEEEHQRVEIDSYASAVPIIIFIIIIFITLGLSLHLHDIFEKNP
ncbi:hypothetical protein MTO98_04510 [Mucilaginibacter sp. SMC90]|uniref:hypothetical protein n=1 Tax=Mucilaginibacter sp. SMC90 TaxID=2929803 RepID=UPI001FB3C1A6|nr:hypothetical protein [Mucilaginibacter sp. SMC90]UOE50334.1 hypothetical protein MTO98_04510 [Mucilaginibacter sp. SMC90]